MWGVWDCVGCVELFDTEGLVLYRGQDVVWGVWDCLILKDWCCTGCGVGCVGLFDTEGLVLYRTAGCGVGCVGLFDTEGLVLYRMWCGVCGTV